jgi:hypothetical protein
MVAMLLKPLVCEIETGQRTVRYTGEIIAESLSECTYLRPAEKKGAISFSNKQL